MYNDNGYLLSSMYMKTERRFLLLLRRRKCTNKGAYKEDQYNGLWQYFDELLVEGILKWAKEY